MEFQRKKYKDFANKQLAGRWKTAAIVTLIMSIISIIFSIPTSNAPLSWDEFKTLSTYSITELWNYLGTTKSVSPGKTALSLIENIISLIMEIAAANFFLAYSRSPEPVSLKTFFEGFNKWGRGILTGLWEGLWLFLWILAGVVVFAIILIPVSLVLPQDSQEAITGILSLILIIVIAVIMIIKSIEYSHVMLLVAEFPELGIRKALRISIMITKGHRMNIFITELTFIPLFLLTIITFGIAGLWTVPYIRMTRINIYHALLKDALETEKLHAEDLN